jgi:hypothetical protein
VSFSTDHTLLVSNWIEHNFSALEIDGSRTFKSTYSMPNASLSYEIDDYTVWED